MPKLSCARINSMGDCHSRLLNIRSMVNLLEGLLGHPLMEGLGSIGNPSEQTFLRLEELKASLSELQR